MLEMLLMVLSYGLSGLNRPLEWKLARDLSGPFWRAFAFLIPFGGVGLKIFLLIPYSLMAAFFLVSAHKSLESKKDS